ncbi:Conserved protein of unknown function [Mycobacterium canettii CIPT 140060008]|nr:Conserved protein of unknown function [Mycobacterium canettii CIPT 140060008]CCK52934.1 Conserved protein of unknown function [Mycobacterium canettii CIPT 140060008]
MHDATGGAGFVRPGLTAFCRLDELGVEVTGQYLDSERAVLACRITDEDRWCRRCGEQGQVRDTVTRRLAHWCTILVSVILDGLPDAPEAPLGYRPARLTAVMSIMSFAESGGCPGRADRRQD